jgi:hypothetical protein
MAPDVYSQAFFDIEEIIRQSNVDSNNFSEILRAKNIPHISYSQINTIEFCEQEYYLQYVKNLQITPTPVYFVKGKLLHKVIAETYSQLQNKNKIDTFVLQSYIEEANLEEQHQNHIVNATNLAIQNLWDGYEILGIEKPFVLNVENELPPFVGIVDLILQQKNQITIVDHKTGSNFYDKDILQGIVYQWYISKEYKIDGASFYYDNYRWVNNLERIRKPALYREKINIPAHEVLFAKDRIVEGYNRIQFIKQKATNRSYSGFRKNGECFRCQFRKICG